MKQFIKSLRIEGADGFSDAFWEILPWTKQRRQNGEWLPLKTNTTAANFKPKSLLHGLRTHV